MFGILAHTLHHATRQTPPRQPDHKPAAKRSWGAPRHWIRDDRPDVNSPD